MTLRHMVVRSPKQGNRIINSILGLKGDSREVGVLLTVGMEAV